MGVRKRPYAFTEQGVAMLAGVLNSDVAVRANIVIMRAFVRMRSYLATTPETLAARLESIDRRLMELEQTRIAGELGLAYEVELPADRHTVLYVDTEQSRTDCQNQMRRILRLAGQSPDTDNPRFVFLSLRQFTPEERIAIIDAAMESLPDIGLIIIDGVRDLLHDINSPTEATTVISLLMKWTDLYQFHLHTVLHQNKSDENARGHLGTELANKAETVMLVEKDKNDADISVVRPAYTRAAEFPPFAFHIVADKVALPEIVGGYSFNEPKTGRPTVGKFDAYSSITEAQHRRALGIIFADQSKEYGYNDFRQAVKSAYGQILGRSVGGNHVSGIIQCLSNKRVVTQEGDRKGKPYRFNPDFVW